MEKQNNLTVFELYNDRDRWLYNLSYTDTSCKSTKVIKNQDGIITVEAYFEQKDTCILKYLEVSVKEIKEKILVKEDIILVGRYINNFNIISLNLDKDVKIKKIDASHSFWDGNTNFSNARFNKGEVNFLGANFGDGNLHFNNMNIKHGNLIFHRACFGTGNVDFCNSYFERGDIIFNNTTFGKGTVRFSHSCFEKCNVSFYKSNFGDGDVVFTLARFNKGRVIFTLIKCGEGEVSFDGVYFGNGNISFDSANFGNGNVKFNGSYFGDGNVNFKRTKYNGKVVTFANTVFGKGAIDFSTANFVAANINFERANFGSGFASFKYTDFSDGFVNFNNANFERSSASFLHAKINEVFFNEQTFSCDINLQFIRINKLYLINCINKAVMKIGGYFNELSFAGSLNMGYIDIDWEHNKVKKSIETAYFMNNAIYGDELYGNEAKSFLYQFVSTKPFCCYNISQDFLLLKENYHNAGQYEYEDAAYRAYMKYNTKSLKLFSKNIFKKLFNGLFGLISGYGTTIWRMLVACPVVMLIFGLLYMPAFIGTSSTPFWKSMYFSVITFLTIGYGDISPVEMAFPKLQVILTGGRGLYRTTTNEPSNCCSCKESITIIIVNEILKGLVPLTAVWRQSFHIPFPLSNDF